MAFIEQIELWTSVSSAILESSLELIPNGIREDSLTQWILNFDALKKEIENRE